MPGSARERLLMRTNHLFGCPFTRIPSRGECICPALDDVVAIEAEAREPLARALAESEKRVRMLEALDGPFRWLGEHYPKAFREMPTEYIRAFDTALLEGEPDAR